MPHQKKPYRKTRGRDTIRHKKEPQVVKFRTRRLRVRAVKHQRKRDRLLQQLHERTVALRAKLRRRDENDEASGF